MTGAENKLDRLSSFQYVCPYKRLQPSLKFNGKTRRLP